MRVNYHVCVLVMGTAFVSTKMRLEGIGELTPCCNLGICLVDLNPRFASIQPSDVTGLRPRKISDDDAAKTTMYVSKETAT